ncbi:MAG: Ig-like domain-containing protein [Verrucomicrobia bacterium]|nr:Ig-like domain-containing protein [Verrucomicrobiota bacterium]
MKKPSLMSRLSGISVPGKPLLRLSLLLTALALPGIASAGNLAGRYATITLDGSLSDWGPGDVMYSASEIGAGLPLNSTFTNVFVANDSSNVYVAFQLSAPAAITNTWITSAYIDTDMSSTTGFNSGWMSAGYDHLVQYGAAGTTYSVYSFSAATQADWGWNWVNLISYSYSDLVIEWAIPISSLALTTNKMRIEFNASGGDVTTETWAYQWESGVGTYTIATAPPPTPPTIAAVEGAPSKVLVTFSKPVTPAMAGATTNYSCSGGLTVLSATPNPLNPSKVTLTTSPQTRGATYSLTVNRVKDEAGNSIAPDSQMAFVSGIMIDGDFGDWEGLPVLFSNDPSDPTAAQFKEVYAFNDANYIYFRLTLWAPSDLLSAQNNIFVDTDNNSMTGNTGWGGSELLIQGGVGYQEKNGGFNEGLINGLDFISANSGNTNYEFRISRAATYVSDGLPLFTTNAINFAFDGEVNWAPVNRMPPTYGSTIPYTLLPGPLAVTLSRGQVTLSWPGTSTLQACDSLTSGSCRINRPTPIPPGRMPGYTAGRMPAATAQGGGTTEVRPGEAFTGSSFAMHSFSTVRSGSFACCSRPSVCCLCLE